jgi:hypothetical protein
MTYSGLKTIIRNAMDKAIVLAENRNEDGSINWNWVDSDTFMDVMDAGIDIRDDTEEFYAEFNRYADEISAK